MTLALALAVADAAGRVLVGHAGRVLDVRAKTSATDPVSEADRASEQLMVGHIRSARPQDGLLGEEGADASSSSGLRWVLDPLDGTVNFLYGHVGWCVSVAVEREREGRWEAITGVVHDPVRHLTFTATRGGGAKLNGEPLHVNDPVPLERALVATGFAYDRDHRRHQADVVRRVIVAARDIRRVGSAALDLCAVAAGMVDGYYEDSTNRWDWAAGRLIAEEAGAVTSDLRGGLVAAGPTLHDELAALVS